METTLDQFRAAVEKHKIDGHGGVSLCYRSLPLRDRYQAMVLLHSERDLAWKYASAARRRLDVKAERRYMANYRTFAELIVRLSDTAYDRHGR